MTETWTAPYSWRSSNGPPKLYWSASDRRERAAQFAYPDLEGDAAERRKSILNVDIHVDTTAGVVALLGRVPLRATAERAEQLAMQNRRRQEKEQSTISGVGDSSRRSIHTEDMGQTCGEKADCESCTLSARRP